MLLSKIINTTFYLQTKAMFVWAKGRIITDMCGLAHKANASACKCPQHQDRPFGR